MPLCPETGAGLLYDGMPVRISLGRYLYAVTQHLLTRRNFLFLNSLKGFWRWRSPAEIQLFIDFIHFIDFLMIKASQEKTLFESFVMLIHKAQPAIRPNYFKKPPGDYETHNFFREDFFNENASNTLITLITIFSLIVYWEKNFIHYATTKTTQ